MLLIYFNYYHYVNYYWRHYNCYCRCCGSAIFQSRFNTVNIHLNLTLFEFPILGGLLVIQHGLLRLRIVANFHMFHSFFKSFLPSSCMPMKCTSKEILFTWRNTILFQYISNKMQRYTVYLYLETALHVSGVYSTHHQEHTRLYLQHLVLVKPLLLPAAIIEGLELEVPTLPR